MITINLQLLTYALGVLGVTNNINVGYFTIGVIDKDSISLLEVIVAIIPKIIIRTNNTSIYLSNNTDIYDTGFGVLTDINQIKKIIKEI